MRFVQKMQEYPEIAPDNDPCKLQLLQLGSFIEQRPNFCSLSVCQFKKPEMQFVL